MGIQSLAVTRFVGFSGTPYTMYLLTKSITLIRAWVFSSSPGVNSAAGLIPRASQILSTVYRLGVRFPVSIQKTWFWDRPARKDRSVWEMRLFSRSSRIHRTRYTRRTRHAQPAGRVQRWRRCSSFWRPRSRALTGKSPKLRQGRRFSPNTTGISTIPGIFPSPPGWSLTNCWKRAAGLPWDKSGIQSIWTGTFTPPPDLRFSETMFPSP